MKDTSIFAKLLAENKIRITIISTLTKPDHSPILLMKDETNTVALKVDKVTKMNMMAVYECTPPYLIELGHRYNIYIEPYGICSLDVSDTLYADDFDTKYFYGGNDLGITYSKESTTFVLWAPQSSYVLLKISKDGKNFTYHQMNRELKGIFRLTLKGDYNKALYNYVIENNGVVRVATDPYAISSTANGRNSVVVDLNSIDIDLENDVPDKLNKYTDAVIYELHVRDFTINKNTNIVHKGKFLGLVEEGRKTTDGKPAGLDYLKYLGVTHVQLLPIYDYKTVDEESPDTKYNWGYDPQQYFVPEGSFSTNPNDGYSRVVELKKMVKKLHHNNIKVIMDVVYNHMYEYATTNLEATVPGYYFRRHPNGTMSNGSFCGDDLATEKKMVSKYIVDCCIHWIKTYGIDGFRFDLMGIIDKFTLMKIYKEAIKIKPDFMIYGEGWNMPTFLPDEMKSSMNNAFALPKIGFFNDTFRDLVKGPTSEHEFYVPGYCTGDFSYREGFKFAYCGSSIHYVYNPKFVNATQSLNYVECHDNGTLYDKIVACKYLTDDKEIFRVLKQVNTVTMFAFGIPFIHMGQEIGLSKNMHQNTYNKGDKYNQMRYDLVDQRFKLVDYMRDLIAFRKKATFMHEYQPEAIKKLINFIDLDSGALLIKYNKVDFDDEKVDIYMFINPGDDTVYYDSELDLEVIFGENGNYEKSKKLYKNLIISPHSVSLYKVKK